MENDEQNSDPFSFGQQDGLCKMLDGNQNDIQMENQEE